MSENNKLLDVTTSKMLDLINSELNRLAEGFIGRAQKVEVEELMWDWLVKLGYTPPWARDQIKGHPTRVLWLYLRGMGLILNLNNGEVYDGTTEHVVGTVYLSGVEFEEGELKYSCVLNAPINYIELKIEV